MPPTTETDRSIVILLWPEYSTIYTSFAYAKKLRARGWNIIYITLPQYEKVISSERFSVITVKHRSATLKRQSPLDRLSISDQIAHHAGKARLFLAAENTIAEVLETYHPKLILLDHTLWRLSRPILRSNTPCLNLHTMLYSEFSWKRWPIYSGRFQENPSVLNKMRIGMSWAALWLRFRGSYLKESFFFILAGAPDWCFFKVRRDIYHLGYELRWSDVGHRLKIPDVVMSAEQLDLPFSVRPLARYLGICVDESRVEPEMASKEYESPFIYCSLGTWSHSYRAAKTAIKAIVEGLLAEPNWHAVIQVGDYIEQSGLGELPDRIVLVRMAPQLEMLRHATAFVTHGGISSIREAVNFGVPMIVLPCQSDQPSNSARVSFHMLGLRSDPAELTPEKVRCLLRELDFDACKQNAGRLMAAIKSVEAESLSWLEEYAANGGN